MRQKRHAICSVEHCTKTVEASGMCCAHRMRMQRYGDPSGGRKTMTGEPLAFFRSTVMTWNSDDCLFWPYARDETGRAKINWQGKPACKVHRIVCTETYGPPAKPELEAAHSCGNGNLGCVNPKHLRWATRVENEADKRRHGTIVQGERVSPAKLTAADVLTIRSLRGVVTNVEIASRYSLDRRYVSAIQHGKTWKHLLPERLQSRGDKRLSERAAGSNSYARARGAA